MDLVSVYKIFYFINRFGIYVFFGSLFNFFKFGLYFRFKVSFKEYKEIERIIVILFDYRKLKLKI